MIQASQEARGVDAGRLLSMTMGDGPGGESGGLSLLSMIYQESLGRPFEMELEVLAKGGRLRADRLLRRGVTVRLRSGPSAGSWRVFHGEVARVWQPAQRDGERRYKLLVVPGVWFLGRRADCRIFQHQTVPEIVTRVLADAGVTDVQSHLKADHPRREFTVQYRESDLAFISRLMEREGMSWYFEHAPGRHTLVLCDSPASFPSRGTTGLGRELAYLPPDGPGVGESAGAPDAVEQWEVDTAVQTGRVSLTDYDFTQPSKDLSSRAKVESRHAPDELEVFDYEPGGFVDHPGGERAAHVRAQELLSGQERYTGLTRCRGVVAGRRFTLTDPLGLLWPEERKDYLVTRVELSARTDARASGEGGESDQFGCRLWSIDARRPFRPDRRTPRPRIAGAQTATVTGPAGQEIYTDAHGRVKVRFRWDRHGRSDETASCWLRVSQPWAGKGWGGVQVPRVGQEVIVEFLEGDPDCPIITGRVYNGESMPPVSGAGRDPSKGETSPADMVQAAMQMTLRSSSLGGSGGHNEITMHDAGGAEKLFIRAQKDEVHNVLNDRLDTVGHDETREVTNDRTRSVGNNEKVTVGKDQSIDVGDNIRIKAGKTITIEVGLSKITMNKSGVITISGTMITVAGMANVNIAAPMTNVAGAAMLNLAGAMVNVQGVYTDVAGSARLCLGGGTVSSIASAGDNVIQGNKVKIN